MILTRFSSIREMIGNIAQKGKDDRDKEERTGKFTVFKVSLCPGSNRQTE